MPLSRTASRVSREKKARAAPTRSRFKIYTRRLMLRAAGGRFLVGRMGLLGSRFPKLIFQYRVRRSVRPPRSPYLSYRPALSRQNYGVLRRDAYFVRNLPSAKIGRFCVTKRRRSEICSTCSSSYHYDAARHFT